MHRLILAIHRFLGLTVGLLIAVVTITGALSLFRPDWEQRPFMLHSGQVQSELPWGDVVRKLRQRYPSTRVMQLQRSFNQTGLDQWTLMAKPAEPTQNGARQPRDRRGPTWLVFTDPATGAWLGDTRSNRWAHLLDGIAHFHHNLWIPPVGGWIVGLAGIALSLLSLTGVLIWIWWWRSRRFTSGRSPWTVWHAWSGLIMSPVLIIIALTGIINAYPVLRGAISAPTMHPAPAAALASTDNDPDAPPQRVDWSDAIARAERQVPAATLLSVAPPRGGSSETPWRVVLRFPGEVSPKDGIVVTIDHRGDVAGVSDPRLLPFARRMAQQYWGYHLGWWGGTSTRVIWMAVGFLIPGLILSGWLMWWRGRRCGVLPDT